jgi:hypothetical protein
MKPYFIGIGAQKSGTSWIYANLSSHPEINMPVKEIHFFSRKRFEEKGVRWYESHFKKKDMKNGEFSTSYLYDDKSAKRIYDLYPNVKLITVLRNPVDRAYSNYNNDIMSGKINNNIDFSSALKEHPEYIEQGFYYKQLKRYFKYFSRGNIKILIYEDIKNSPKLFMREIYEFLNVDSNFISPNLYKRINPSYIPKSQRIAKLKRNAIEIMKKILSGNSIKLLKKTKLYSIINSQSIKEFKTNELNVNERKYLYKNFKKSICLLEALINKDLTHWKI